mmetsp:Transcript_80928/g.252470  ORF Transcript_80928/g.252470 Transcript_80928/m.252470 type:complete len:428 (+) Transcript_80928:75-1358(+)
MGRLDWDASSSPGGNRARYGCSSCVSGFGRLLCGLGAKPRAGQVATLQTPQLRGELGDERLGDEVGCPLSELLALRLQKASQPASSGEAGPEPGLRCWSEGDAQKFRLRCGPNYRWFGRKARPGPALYRCVSVDVMEGLRQIRSALAGLPGASPLLQAQPEALQRRFLPEVIILHFQLPFQSGPLIGQHPPDDQGCSVMIVFAATPEALLLNEDSTRCSPGARLLSRYFSEGGHPFVEGSYVSGCLKVVGVLENPEDLDIPAAMGPIVRRFNGKPVLVERESHRYWVSERPDVVELTIDVRGFNPLARSMLRRLRGQLRRAVIQLGILIQGCTDDELPEQLLGAARLSGLDLLGGRRVEVVPDSCQHPGLVGPCDGGLGSFAQALRRALRCGVRRHKAAVPAQVSSGGRGSEPATPWFTPRSRTESC